jgi:hypothetical protein
MVIILADAEHREGLCDSASEKRARGEPDDLPVEMLQKNTQLTER